MKKNVAGQSVGAQMVSATDGSAFTGSVTVAVTLDAGTQATGTVGSGACTHEGNGYHTYAPSQAETNGDLAAFTFTGTGAIPVTVQIYTSFPQTGDGFARLGAPAGASVSADVAAVKSDTGTTLTRIGVAGAGLTAIGDTRLANLDATVSSRSTYAGTDTSGTTTLLSRLSTTRAGNLDNLDAAVSTRSTYAGGAVASVTGNVGGNVVGSIGSVASGGITTASFGIGAIDGPALASTATEKISDALIARNIAGGSNTGRTVAQALAFLRNRKAIAAGTLTVYQSDDSTSSWTAAVTTTAGNPVSEVDPA